MCFRSATLFWGVNYIVPPTLRPFQKTLEKDCYSAWDAGAVNVMPVAATGSGKTVLLSKLLYDEPGASIAIAHRQELVSQISIALARNGVRHRVVGARKGSPLVRIITALQVAELGYSFLDPTARCGVGGVDTIVRMQEPWFAQVRLAVQDEGHHVLATNKWGRAASLFPRARGLFPTATPLRADGRGLGRHADGLTDALVLAPSMRDIINMGYLTDYTVLCPKSDLNLSQVATSPTTGDYNKDQVRAAVHKSTITGDVVKHYLRVAPGKLGITFAVDVEEAARIATAFNAAGVPAEVVSWNTPDGLRTTIMRRFRNREILQVVNVDMFGEGVDIPAVEVVSMGRPTKSFGLYSQQFGRALRLMIPEHLQGPGVWDGLGDAGRLKAIAGSVKPKAIILDHVGNLKRMVTLGYGLPDTRREWSLDRRERRAKRDSDAIPLKVCVECLQPYESVLKRCPYCDHYMAPASRGGPEFVDGDLTELDPSVLAALRGEIARVDGDYQANNYLPIPAQLRNRNLWQQRQEGQRTLRTAVAWWAGVEHARGHSESESYRRFYFRFGVDVANAQLLGAREAEELATKVCNELAKYGVDGSVSIPA
jgi:DNA repair protein RadD